MADEEKNDPKSLVQSILSKKPEAPSPEGEPLPPAPTSSAKELAAPADPDPPLSAHPEHLEAAELIDLYFALEEPLERDACFDQIVLLSAPLVVEFLRAMLQGDADEYVRAAAAAELTRRGDAEGRSALEEDLADPENVDFFTNALQTFAESDGAAFYDRLVDMWRRDSVDDELMLQVLATMEAIDAIRACKDFASTLDSIATPDAFRDDQFEVMVMAFVRNEFWDAQPVLQRLHERTTQFAIGADERSELEAFVSEGIALLQGA